VSLPRQIQLKALNIGLEVFNATQDLMKETASLVNEVRQMFSPDGDYWSIPQEVLDQYNMTNEEFKDSIDIMLNKAEDVASELAAAAKSAEIPEVTVGNPDPETGEQRLVLAYGNHEVTLKGTDTLESLSMEFYGTPDKAIDIATYNGVASLDELNAGNKIKIPITQKGRAASIRRNLIFARREDRDNYGRDIYLNEDGCVEPSTTGDFKLTDGPNNLAQAILLRLRESVTKRIRLNIYGIRTNISDPAAGIAYILSSINQTVMADPRVKSIDDIRFSGNGDSLIVFVEYSDINKANGTVAGRT
jgi:hypothetical protein